MLFRRIVRGETERVGDLRARRRRTEDFKRIADEVKNLLLSGVSLVTGEPPIDNCIFVQLPDKCKMRERMNRVDALDSPACCLARPLWRA